jgi:hypothetical protein
MSLRHADAGTCSPDSRVDDRLLPRQAITFMRAGAHLLSLALDFSNV